MWGFFSFWRKKEWRDGKKKALERINQNQEAATACRKKLHLLSMCYNLRKIMMTFSEHTIACHNLFFKYLVLFFCWFHFVCLLSQFTLFSSGFTLNSLSHLYVLVFLSLNSLDFYFFMPFPKNPRSLPPLHFGFLGLY